MNRIPALLIIDPHHKVPETDAINTITRIAYKTMRAANKFFVIQTLTPAHFQNQTSAILHDLNPIGIISLGSYANVTEDHAWFETFEALITRYVFEKKIPFLGICFTHQYVAKMLGAKVNFLKNRKNIRCGRHDGHRSFTLVHSKLRLYFATIDETKLGTECKDDLDFKEALRFSKSLDAHGWKVLRETRRSLLHPRDARFLDFLTTHCPQEACFAVAHEQEVHELPKGLVAAAESLDCQYEAFVSEKQDIITFQAHPEYELNLLDGKRLIRNFVYSLCI